MLCFAARLLSMGQAGSHFELMSVDEVKGNGLAILERGTVEIEGEDKPGCVAEIIMRLYF